MAEVCVRHFSREGRSGRGALRMFLLGSAGTGKSRTVRAFVGGFRDRLRADYDQKTATLFQRGARPQVVKKLRQECAERVGNVCLLAAPTGCASFQLKFGASTLHRGFGVPVG